ncbi:MAG: DNA modification methylase [Candidatus Alkanophagales archaeon MCA70_species_2]|nr:DNA modification methylase [Candidatus Alkanophaga liquidiphilum]
MNSKQNQKLINNPQQTLFMEQTVMSIYPLNSVREGLEAKFKNKMHEGLRLSSSVSYVGNKKIPFLRIYRYKEAFAFNFVKDFLKRFGADSDDYVFDPFSGLGTTMFTSMLSGIPSIGIDKLPVAYFISKTLPLFLFLKENEIKKVWESTKPRIETSKPADVAMDVPIMQVAFNEKNLLLLRKLKSAIDGLSEPYKDIFLLLFFSILEECSFTSKDGQFLRLKRNKKVSDPIEAMSKKVAQVEEDIHRIKFLHPSMSIDEKVIPDVYLADTRDLSNIKFRQKPTIIITSPPYANRYDYTRTYSLELCFHFVKNFEELKAIRFGILRSHIESKIKKDEKPPHPAVEEVIDALSKKKLNNPKIPDMITAYFVDMLQVIKEWYKVLAPGAKVAMVVDNVRFEGEMVPVDLILSEMAEEIGFEVKEIIIARYKGNSSQQMKKYGKVPVRESIVIWER